MSTFLAFLAGLAVGTLAGGGAVWGWITRRPAAAPAAGPVSESPRTTAQAIEPPATGDEEVRQVMAASQATLAELEGRYRGRRAAGPEEGERPKRRSRPKRTQ